MTEPTSPRTYEVRINGLVPAGAVAEELLEELGDVQVTGHDVTTVLSGWFADQQELAEFLRRLRAYGLEVVEIRRVAEEGGEGAAGDAGGQRPAPEHAGNQPAPEPEGATDPRAAVEPGSREEP